jgi:hypothetical protein
MESPTEESVCLLGFDRAGMKIKLAPEAVGFKVLVSRQGHPVAVQDPDAGGPLHIPLATLPAELRDKIGSGRFVLVQVDERLDPIPKAATAYVEFLADRDEEAFSTGGVGLDATQAAPYLQLIGRLVDTHCRAMEAMASAFGPVRPARTPYAEAPVAGDERAMRPDELVQGVASVVKSVADVWGKNSGNGAASGGGV